MSSVCERAISVHLWKSLHHLRVYYDSMPWCLIETTIYYRAKWEKISSIAVEVRGLQHQGLPLHQEKASRSVTVSTMAKRHKNLAPSEQMHIIQLEVTLTNIALCYFMRPFRDGQGGVRFLDPHEMFFHFASDFGVVPELISRSECRMLIYNTVGDNYGEFAAVFRDLRFDKYKYDLLIPSI
jgi:hypothetical protein